MDYTIEFKTFNNPSITFQLDDELNEGSYDLLENEYTFKDITAEIELGQYQDFLQQLNATSDIEITAIGVFYGLDDSTLRFASKGVLSVGDEVLIEDEIVKVSSISGVGTTQIITATRGWYGTRKAGHNNYLQGSLSATVGGRYSPIGLEGDLINEDGEVIQKVYLTDFKSNGNNIILNFEKILNKFDREFYMHNENIDNDIYPSLGIALKKIYNGIIETSLSFDELVKDIRIIEQERGIVKISPVEALKTLLELTGAYMVYDKTTELYHVKTLLGLSIFDTITSSTVNLYDKVILNGGGYESTVQNLANNLHIKYKTSDAAIINSSFAQDPTKVYGEEPNFTERTYTIQAHTTGASLEAIAGVKEIDLTDYLLSDSSILKKIARKYMYIFGLILGHLELSAIPNHGFEEGSYYRAENLGDLNEIVAFIDTSKSYVLFCYNQDSEMAKFIILDIEEFQPISPALIVNVNDVDEVELVLDIQDFLYTEGEYIEFSEHIDYSYLFFEVGQEVQFRSTEDYSLISSETITAINNNVVTLASGILSGITNPVIMAYTQKSVADSIQNKHLFVDSGVL